MSPKPDVRRLQILSNKSGNSAAKSVQVVQLVLLKKSAGMSEHNPHCKGVKESRGEKNTLAFVGRLSSREIRKKAAVPSRY